MKNIKNFYLKIFIFWVVKCSIYLNRLVFVMLMRGWLYDTLRYTSRSFYACGACLSLWLQLCDMFLFFFLFFFLFLFFWGFFFLFLFIYLVIFFFFFFFLFVCLFVHIIIY